MGQQIPAEVLSLWRNDQKIEAIKQLRETTGLGLKESKELLEATDGLNLDQINAEAQVQSLHELREQLDKLGMTDASKLLDALKPGANNGSNGSSFTSVKTTTTTVNGKTTRTVTASGDRDQAIQLLMSSTDMGQDEASAQIDAALARGDKVGAVKLLRDAAGLGLAEAKDYIDAAMQGDKPDWAHLVKSSKKAASYAGAESAAPASFQSSSIAPGEVPRSQGWFWWLLLAIALAMGAWFYFKSA